MSGKFSGGEVLLEKCLLSAFHLHHAVTLLYNGFLPVSYRKKSIVEQHHNHHNHCDDYDDCRLCKIVSLERRPYSLIQEFKAGR